MPFASASQATDSKGKIKDGFKEFTDKNGKTRYLSMTPAPRKPKTVKAPEKKTKTKTKKKDKDPSVDDPEQFAVRVM